MHRINGRCGARVGILSLAFGTATALCAQCAAHTPHKPRAGTYGLLIPFSAFRTVTTPLLRWYGTPRAIRHYRYGGNSVRGIGLGIVFKITPDGTETVLHTFAGPHQTENIPWEA